ncbi:hypothetical protein FA13DRAFT_1790506 [Coprinellus micaceus]|uniref:Uncharacterized protein n=1 Tax=Coprinellus micaceus TaxID=71717 RepID=A0A4Y7TF69_COPMI|nr:hypothetical protein FA13DRAFT_1790506 [Coprinellus micaceus]
MQFKLSAVFASAVAICIATVARTVTPGLPNYQNLLLSSYLSLSNLTQIAFMLQPLRDNKGSVLPIFGFANTHLTQPTP